MSQRFDDGINKTVPNLLRHNCLAPDHKNFCGDEERRNSKLSAGTSSAVPLVVRIYTNKQKYIQRGKPILIIKKEKQNEFYYCG